MISSFVRALISAFKARRELVPADELNRRHRYRRLTFMMLDEDVVAVSPSTTYRVLSKAGRLDRWNPKPSKKGTGFVQPLRVLPQSSVGGCRVTRSCARV